MRKTLFSPEVIEKAESLEPEKDEVLPGTWHVVSGENEYKVQTDEEIEDDHVYWASCTCPHGLAMRRGIARCSHVAAVLMILLAQQEPPCEHEPRKFRHDLNPNRFHVKCTKCGRLLLADTDDPEGWEQA